MNHFKQIHLWLGLLCNVSFAELKPTNLDEFKGEIRPFLNMYCLECHEGEDADAEFRLDNIDGFVTNGNDIERWEKAYEMISIQDMPPSNADHQPDKLTRRKIESWIKNELKKIGRGPDDARLSRPEFGNRLDHEDLFSGEHKGPAYSPPRIWRKSKQIHKSFENVNRLKEGNTPFPPKGGENFQDYAMLYANQSTITTLKINAQNYVAEWVHGKLTHPRGEDGKPDKTRQVREGKSRWREFNELTQNEENTKEHLENAVYRGFQLFLYRDPTEEEMQRYAHEFLKKAIDIGGKTQGLETLLKALILSPEFIYRQELGLGKELPDGRRMLSPNEIAYAISFALTDQPPDNTLKDAIRNGKLETRKDVEREVRRMLEVDTRKYWAYEINHSFESHLDACPNPRILRFFREFFGYSHIFDVFKDKSRNPNHKPPFIFKDADLFVLSILEKDEQVLKNLLTSNHYVVHYADPQRVERTLANFRKDPEKNKAVLAKLEKGITPVLGGYRGGEYFTTYGFEKETWNYPIEQPFPVENRAGMLTHPAWLVAHSGNFDTDPIRRGKWIREHLLADTIPEIPIGVDAALEDDPHKTLRQKLEKTSKQSCWRCHKKMNPLGLPFEAFDDFGRFRTDFYYDEEKKIAGTYYERLAKIKFNQQRKNPEPQFTTQPIDTSGELYGTGDEQLDGDVKDAFDLVHRLAKSEKVRQSFVRHAFRFWMGRNETYDDSPTLIAADNAYVENNGSFKELLISLLTSDSFLMRKDPK
jgi:hypothetical protein